MMPRHSFTLHCKARSCASVKRSGCSDCNRAISALPVASGSACNHTSTSLQTPSKGSWRVTPMPRTSYSRGVGGTGFALPPQIGQFGEEPFEAFSRWRFPHVRRRGCHQGRLGLTDGVQQLLLFYDSVSG